MTIVAVFLWILIWGLAGYFTVRAIIMHIQKKRMEKAWAAYVQHQRLMRRYPGKFTTTHFSSDPFEDLLKKDV